MLDKKKLDTLVSNTLCGNQKTATGLQAISLHRIANLLDEIVADMRERRTRDKRDDARWAAEEEARRKAGDSGGG